MVRNWQSRVELNETRRHHAKQKKQRSEDKRLYKGMVVKLMGLLDRHRDVLRRVVEVEVEIKGGSREDHHRHRHHRRRILHIWTDTKANDSSQPDSSLVPTAADDDDDDDDDAEGHSTTKGKGGSKGGRGGKGGGGGSKKKAHPRSHEAAAAVDTPEHKNGGSKYDDTIRLCKPHFFAGTCRQHYHQHHQGGGGGGSHKGGAGSGSGSGCRRMHYTMSQQYKTLNTICSSDKNDKTARDKFSLAEEAVPPEEDPHAMEMIYYSSHILVNSGDDKEQDNDDDDKEQDNGEESDEKGNKETAISDALNEALVGKGLGITSIVYAALDGVLIFDRNRNGVILSDQDFLVDAIGGKASGFRHASGGSEGDGAFDPDLPGQVLEYILTFLPDSAVSTASQVCKAWHHEIGRNSPNLWRHMLERREWPLPAIDHAPEPTKEANDATHRLFREAFLRHYSVLRDVSAIQSAMGGMMLKRGVDRKKEMSYQDFSTRKSAPSVPNACVSVQVWGPNRILAAYGADCSLRLFATVPKLGSDESLCRELVCQRIDPYQYTKKRTCQILSVGLDEEFVGSLCHVMTDGVDADVYVLVILNRDDFLQGESSGAGDSEAANLRVIDIGEAVINYLLNLDDVDDPFLPMLNFLADGGDSGEMEVLVSPTLAACGYGRFMVEVSVSVPVLDLDDEGNGESTLQLLDRRMILFSASIGDIVWMGENQPFLLEPRPRHVDLTLTCVRRPYPGGSRSGCHIAVACTNSPAIMVGEIEPTGHVQSAQLLDGPELVRSEILEEGWDISTMHSRPVLIVPSDVVASDTLFREVENRGKEFRSVISFYPRYQGADDALYSILPIPGNMEIIRMSSFRDEHVVAICREFDLSNNDLIDVEDLGGQWFGANMEAVDHKAVHAVIIHVPSRREIGRVKLMDDEFDYHAVPQITVTNDDTIGVGISWKGVIMTGNDVRSLAERSDTIVLDDTLTPAKAAKVKTARRKNKGDKKLGSRQKVKHK